MATVIDNSLWAQHSPCPKCNAKDLVFMAHNYDFNEFARCKNCKAEYEIGHELMTNLTTPLKLTLINDKREESRMDDGNTTDSGPDSKRAVPQSDGHPT